jgi:hypothetical protein
MIKLVGIRKPTLKPVTCELAADLMDEFQYISYRQEVIFAPSALAHLDQVMDRYGWQRLMLCTNRSLGANGRLASLAAVLGDRLVVVYDQVKPHVQDFQNHTVQNNPKPITAASQIEELLREAW